MTTSTQTLADFLLEQIAADESFALSATAAASIYDPALVKWHWIRTNGESSAWEPTTFDPARVLAECAAKRAIVDWVSAAQEASARGDEQAFHDEEAAALTVALRALAQPYADRGGFREEWA